MREQQEESEGGTFTVVVNLEEQYSIWFADRPPPAGWKEAGKTGSKAECLAFIKDAWTDMRPLSLRNRMEEFEKLPIDPAPPAAPAPRHPSGVNELVARLQEPQPIEAALRAEPRAAHLREQIDRGRVFVTFVRTGTELGIRIDRSLSDVANGDFSTGRGVVSLVGELTLNSNRVRFHGELDLATFQGIGRLEYLGEPTPVKA